jgi:alkylation response protein AidB-like acyl-CoA dehydrogenase
MSAPQLPSQASNNGQTRPESLPLARPSAPAHIVRDDEEAIRVAHRAGRFIDTAIATPDEETVAAASIAVSEAKVLTTETAILATNRLCELAGTRSTLAVHNLDRHWRNARAHTLHDPARWKYHAVGNYYLNKVKPPRHAWI